MGGSEYLLDALEALYNATDNEKRRKAGEYLEEFQKSAEAWQVCHDVLAGDSNERAKVFCAQTLRSKIQYDLAVQVPPESRIQLKTSLMQLLSSNIGSRLVATQLSVALANLALQATEWHNVVEEMASQFSGSDNGMRCLLEFLKVLPEEMGDSKRVAVLSDEEFRQRVEELLTKNASHVVQLLIDYVQSPQSKNVHALVFECLNSWLSEIDIEAIIREKPLLLDLIFGALQSDDTFDAGVECVCSVIRETRDVVESMEAIKALYPRVVALRPRISESKDDPEMFRGLTRIFSEAGESWHVLMAKLPKDFRGLVESIAECTAMDEDLEVVQYTFYFWYSLKQLLVLPSYSAAKHELEDVYMKLIDIIIHHLHYPAEEAGGELFSDKEEEDKFRSFRHEMGDVLKDCCAVVGSAHALRKAYNKVVAAVHSGARWQDVEAPLFSMRAMAREVELSEKEILPSIMEMLVKLPEHEKIRYAATLVLGRYTEWTDKHPQYLDFQLQYITKGFEMTSCKPVMSAAAQALMHFCQDCGEHLVNYLEMLYTFYDKVAGELELDALYEVTDGIAHVILAQPVENVQIALSHFCQPIVRRILEKSQQAPDEAVDRAIADEIELLTIFVSIVRPSVPHDAVSPTSKFVIELYPALVPAVLSAHGASTYVAERNCKFIKTCLHTCKIDLAPILGQIAETLVREFNKTHFGCYLWVSGALVREFGDDEDDRVNDHVKKAVWHFAEQQSVSFFQHLTVAPPKEVPDLVEDFFRLMGDLLMYFPYEFIESSLLKPSFDAALSSLALEQVEPVTATLHFLQDLFAFGNEKPPVSRLVAPVPDRIRRLIFDLASSDGQQLCARLISGLIFSFPRDCVTDASSLVLSLIKLVPALQALEWISTTLDMLPHGSVSNDEKQNLLHRIQTAINSGDFKRVRTLLRDFTAMYARRNVTPRSSSVSSAIQNLVSDFSYNN
ncbi:mRNA transport regulator Mtr10p [Trichomonascus vanleenenianus]|uniref:mRNA transport regulator MTR10 n=1 Tax=Trichomonascus vanleenenianus TaxID=2268995 RepID=UPI003ECAD226